MTHRRTSSMTALPMAAACVTVLLSSSPAAAQGTTTAPWPIDQFCGRAQGYVTLAARPARNVLHEGYDSFRDAAASVQPLESQQYTVADETAGSARIVSCKLVTAEALRAAYGAEAARSDSSCSLVNRNTFTSVLASLTPAERSRARFDQARRSSSTATPSLRAPPPGWSRGTSPPSTSAAPCTSRPAAGPAARPDAACATATSSRPTSRAVSFSTARCSCLRCPSNADHHGDLP